MFFNILNEYIVFDTLQIITIQDGIETYRQTLLYGSKLSSSILLTNTELKKITKNPERKVSTANKYKNPSILFEIC